MNIMGIDFGLKNVGIAISKCNIIFPFVSLKYNNFNNLIAQIAKIVYDEKINLILIGDPFVHQNNNSQFSFHINAFINKMHNNFKNIKILSVDEYHTTNDSIALLKAFGYKNSKIKLTKDMISACKIIENYYLKNIPK